MSHWMLTRLVPLNEAYNQRLDDTIKQALANCARCSGIYDQTGFVPLECSACGAQRGPDWTQQIDDSAIHRSLVYRISSRLHHHTTDQ